MQQKFELLLKKLNYPYCEGILLSSEPRLKFIEYLLQLHSETLFQYCQMDHSETNMRIKAIKCQLCLSGFWGQSKYGRNVDLNKLIQGLCSFEQSLHFVYKLGKHILERKYDEDIGILRDCLKVPQELINRNYDPFDLSIPKEEEYVDNKDYKEEVEDILELQQQDLEKLSNVDGGIELGNINGEDIQEYSKKMRQTIQMIVKLKEREKYLEQIQIENDLEDKYQLEFPEKYNETMEIFNSLGLVQKQEQQEYKFGNEQLVSDYLYFL